MGSVSRQREALLAARRRRIQLDVDRAAKERRALEATGVVRVRQQELADAEAAADRARARLGAALRQLVDDSDLERACASAGLTPTQVRSLTRLAARAKTGPSGSVPDSFLGSSVPAPGSRQP